jgi:GAF domain-containing protein
MEALTRLSRALLTERELQHDLDAILAVADATVPGCEGASVTLVIEGKPRTQAAVDRIVVAIDLAQYEAEEGPCLLAAAENRPVIVDRLALDDRFPRFAERAAETGVQSSLSLPVVVDGAVVGSLNLYASVPSAFDASSQDIAAVLATQVGTAVAKSRVLPAGRDVVVSAQEFADEQADIGVAEGMLMVIEQCSVEQAAALLRNAASSEAESLVAIARRIIQEVQSQPRKRANEPNRTD